MSVELLNDCVIVPHRPNWKSKVRNVRRWETSIVDGVTGAEDKSSGRADPLRHVGFEFFTFNLQERARLVARLNEALKKGRACGPLWSRGSELAKNVKRENEAFLRGSRWPWKPDDWAFFVSSSPEFENRSTYINCGGAAVGSWIADAFFANGTNGSTTHTINTSAVKVVDENGVMNDGWEAAPESVYQTWRGVDNEVSATTIIYTLSNLILGQEYLIRLHFAENRTSGYHNATQLIRVTGLAKTERTIAPVSDVGEYAALIHELRVVPKSNGEITIDVEPVTSSKCGGWHAFINAIEVHRITWETRRMTLGTNMNRLKWDSRLMGRYDEGAMVYPIIFGKPVVQDVGALTNWHQELNFRIAEPLGQGAKATPGLCAVEVCGDDSYPEWGGVGFLPSGSCGAGTTAGLTPWQHSFNSGGQLCAGNSLAPGKVPSVGQTVNPSDYLSLALIRWWKALATASLEADRAAVGKLVGRKQFYWAWITNASGWDVVYNYQYNGTGFSCYQPAAWTLLIKYCEQNA